MNEANKAQHIRQRAKRAKLDMLDNEHGEQEGSSLVYRFPRHDSLMNRVQLKISSYLLLSLHLAATLVTK